jgi:4-carboxymuconolactone decarboxylase
MAQAPSTESRDRVRGTVPKLIDLSEKVLFGDVWERPQLSKRDRSLIVCATLIATTPASRCAICSARSSTA